MTDASALVIENADSDPVARLGDWLRGAGLSLTVVRPFDGDPVPDSLDDYAALVVLGGPQAVYDPDSNSAWFAAEQRLLRRAVADRVPTLAICLGAQMLAHTYGGTVTKSPSGPEIGARLVARRDAAESDPLFSAVPFTPDVIQWHFDEIISLPAGATLLATSPRYEVQAFRLGTRAWATQFHIECTEEMVRLWASRDSDAIRELGLDPEAVADKGVAALDDIEEVWRPFAERFAALTLGQLDIDSATDPARQLPIVGD